MKMSMEQQPNDTDRQKRKYSKKNLYLCLFSTINLAINCLGTNPDLCDERKENNGLKI